MLMPVILEVTILNSTVEALTCTVRRGSRETDKGSGDLEEREASGNQCFCTAPYWNGLSVQSTGPGLQNKWGKWARLGFPSQISQWHGGSARAQLPELRPSAWTQTPHPLCVCSLDLSMRVAQPALSVT